MEKSRENDLWLRLRCLLVACRGIKCFNKDISCLWNVLLDNGSPGTVADKLLYSCLQLLEPVSLLRVLPLGHHFGIFTFGLVVFCRGARENNITAEGREVRANARAEEKAKEQFGVVRRRRTSREPFPYHHCLHLRQIAAVWGLGPLPRDRALRASSAHERLLQ